MIMDFTTPNRDVELRRDSDNTIVYEVERFKAGHVLIRYLEKTVATVGGDSSYEIVLEATDDPYKHMITVYRRDGSIAKYSVPEQVYGECNGVIAANDMHCWSDMKDTISIDGVVISCSFLWNGKYMRASSDAMPEDGELIFSLLKTCLTDVMTEENLI